MTPPDGLEPRYESAVGGANPAGWNPGPAPGPVKSWLMRLSGVDFDLARHQPQNEQRLMAIVGAALVFGSLFLGMCVFVALDQMIEGDIWRYAIIVPIATLAAGIVFIYDSQLVSDDWIAQGLAFCRSRSIAPAGYWLEIWARPATIALRWGVSLAIAMFVSWFVLAKAFAPDINRDLARENLAVNASVYERVEGRFEVFVDEAQKRLAHLDRRLHDLREEHAELGHRGSIEPLLDREIEALAVEVASLKTSLANAEKQAADHETAAEAEHGGVRWTDQSTGRKGDGDVYKFHKALAARFREQAAGIRTELDQKAHVLVATRNQAAASAETAKAQSATRLQTIELQTDTATSERVKGVAELKSLEDSREAWIQAHARRAFGFVPQPTGLSDRFRALWHLVKSSELIAAIALGLKLFIMALESAGPIAKTLFGSARIYSMRAAMRIEDAVEDEAERRETRQHRAFLRQCRREEEREAAVKRKRFREMAKRGLEEVNAAVHAATHERLPEDKRAD